MQDLDFVIDRECDGDPDSDAEEVDRTHPFEVQAEATPRPGRSYHGVSTKEGESRSKSKGKSSDLSASRLPNGFLLVVLC